MRSFTPSLSRVAQALSLTAALACTGFAGAQTDKAAAPSAAQAQREREACLSGKSGQDQAACLKEVGAAREEAKRGGLDSGQGQLASNRSERCKALTGADQADCYARMKGEGTVEGSVKGGGLIREKRTVIPAEAPAARGGSATSGAAGASPGTGGTRPANPTGIAPTGGMSGTTTPSSSSK